MLNEKGGKFLSGMDMEDTHLTQSVVKLSNQIHKMFYVFSHSNGAQSCILNVLLENCPEKGLCQKDIQTILNTSPATIAATLKRLEKQGLIVRERLPGDERRKIIRPTALAMERKEEIRQELDSIERRLVSGIGQKELEVFADVIQRMMKNC